MPAIICAAPPKANPIATITIERGIKSALCKLSRIVVMPKPKSPKGDGLAIVSNCFSLIIPPKHILFHNPIYISIRVL